MRWFWLVFVFQSLCFGQKSSESKVDSTKYYIQLANFNKKTNNYKFGLLYSQKAYNYAKSKQYIDGMGDAMFSLGSIYFELNKLNDAIETYTKSAEYHSQIEPSSDYALCYYNIGLCYMDLENYPKAEQNFDQSAKIYATLKIDASETVSYTHLRAHETG
jgi:tetratricopeptide (TPR) repeat protein